ncbi:MAG: hypothetical protein EGQ74_21850 [Bacteroides nordii]|nr:hypothetical protein [Bacteroides nordii]
MGNEKEDDYYIYIFHAFLVFNFIYQIYLPIHVLTVDHCTSNFILPTVCSGILWNISLCAIHEYNFYKDSYWERSGYARSSPICMWIYYYVKIYIFGENIMTLMTSMSI